MHRSRMETGHEGSADLPDDGIQPGSRIGAYTIRRFIASGGFGRVYEVESPDHPDGAALKIMHAELRELGDAFIRFLREGNLLEQIRHPNVVEVYHSGVVPDGRAYLVTELLTGRDLDEHIAIGDKLDLDSTMDILDPVSAALSAAHAKGVIHRDIKASNIFLDESMDHRRVVLLDFGLAKALEGDELAMTRSRMALGTPATMSPEQLRGAPVTARTDVYGLGTMTFHMLAGQLPFAGSSRTQMQYMHLHGERPRPSSLANVSRAIDDVVVRAMACDPRDRQSGPAEFLADMRRAISVTTQSRVARRSQRLEVPAFAILVDLRSAGEDSEDTDLDELDAVLDEADTHLTRCGFVTGLEASSFVLFVKKLDVQPGLQSQQRREAVLAASQLRERLDEGADNGRQRDPKKQGVHVNIVVHADTALFDDHGVRGGDLMRLERWAPQEDVSGVVGSSAVFDDIDVDTEAVDGRDDLMRLVAFRPQRRRKRASTENEDSAERLMHSEMMARIGRQTAGIVHDLRSPLNVVIGNLQYAIEQLGEGRVERQADGGLRSPLEQAMEAAEQLMGIVSSVRQAAAVNSYQDDQRVVAINDVVTTALKLAASETRQKAAVEVCPDGDCKVRGIPGRLTQALVNLLVNAAHAIPESGRISVTTRDMGDGHVELTVEDSGIGMSAEVRDKIFEPFFTTKDVEQGTGLGLSLVKEIIEEHDGTISVDSEPGHGARFIIVLPTVQSPIPPMS